VHDSVITDDVEHRGRMKIIATTIGQKTGLLEIVKLSVCSSIVTIDAPVAIADSKDKGYGQ